MDVTGRSFDNQGPVRGRFGARKGQDGGSVPGAAEKSTRLVVNDQAGTVAQEDGAVYLFAPGRGQEDVGPHYGYRRHRLRKNDEVSVYNESMDARFGADKRGKRTRVLAGTFVLMVLAAVVLPAGFFSARTGSITVAGFIDLVSMNVSGLLGYVSGESATDPMGYKLARYLVIALAGAALGISGGVYQGALKNALASPTTLGVISGGTLGAMFFVIAFMPSQAEHSSYEAQDIFSYYASLTPIEYAQAIYGQTLCTLVGCFVVVGLVVLVATIAGRGHISNVVLIVTGQVVAVVINSVMTLIRTYYASGYGDLATSEALASVRSSSFSNYYSLLDLALMGIPILAGVVVVVAMRMRLNALTFSDEEARSMGISTAVTRGVMVGACTLMTAVVVAFCGSISFVGFVVPHLTRKVMGPDFKYYIPATALVGASFMVLTYFVTSFFALEDIGGVRLLTAFVGAVAFVIVALANRNRTTSDGF